jgi:hypothetical protein
MLGAAFVLPALPGHPGLACPLRAATGVPCPLCGMTTSVEDTVHLHVGAALAANPAGVLAVAAAVLALVVRPRRVTMPTAAGVMLMASMWLFELHRYGFF